MGETWVRRGSDEAMVLELGEVWGWGLTKAHLPVRYRPKRVEIRLQRGVTRGCTYLAPI